MIDVSWNIEDEDRESELAGTPRTLLGTWHYLRNSLRREWRTWAAVAALGAWLGMAAVVLVPPSSVGTVTILMAHPANLDGPSAMGTDVSLLNTREVAARTVQQLGLKLPPESFQSTVSAEAVTTEILVVSVSGPDDASAVVRADALTTQYLDFRATQLRSLSSGLITGYKARITDMQGQVTDLSREYSRVSEQGAAGQSRASEILTRRTELNSQIIDMQQAIEDAALATDAAVTSTHVIDAARAVGHSRTKTGVLDIASGLIGGTALGVGFVLFRALTSDRLRRRQDVALALGVPVRFSVSSPGSGGRRSLLPTGRKARAGWRGHDLEALVRGLESAVMPRPTVGPGLEPSLRSTGSAGPAAKRGVALAAIGNAGVAASVVAALAAQLRAAGLSVFLVDLSRSGALVARLSPGSSRGRGSSAGRHGHRATRHDADRVADSSAVFRPHGDPVLARGPLDGAAAVVSQHLSDGEDPRVRWEAADVVLVLAEVDPGLDAEHLRTWVAQVVPLVTAGRSSPELLETTAELIRASGLTVPFAMMVGCDRTDESLGLLDLSEPASSASLSRS